MFGNKGLNVSDLIQRIMNTFTQLTTSISEKCVFCNEANAQKSAVSFMGLCSPCSISIPWIKEAKCDICGRYETCNDCNRREKTNFKSNRSAVQYSNEMRNWLARYKYRGDEKLLSLFTDMLRYPYEKLVQENLTSGENRFDIITYIPLSTERLSERGFNQAKQLAVGIGEIYKTPVLSLIERIHHTGKQSYKTRGQRINDLQGVFAFDSEESLLKPYASSSRSLNILLVDDVYTTGSTLNQAASVIREQLNAQVYGLTWAR